MQPFLVQYFRCGLASPERPCEHRTIQLSWLDELPPRACVPRSVGLRRVVGVDENGRFPTAATISARAGREAGEHWRRLTSRAVEPGQPVGPEARKPNKTGGLTDSRSEEHTSELQ